MSDEIVTSDAMFRQNPETGDLEIILPCACGLEPANQESWRRILAMESLIRSMNGKISINCDP